MPNLPQVVVVALLAACAGPGSWAPDYFEVSPFYSEGELWARGPAHLDTEETGLLVTLGWSLIGRREEARAEETATWREMMRELAVVAVARDSGVSAAELAGTLQERTDAQDGEPEAGPLDGILPEPPTTVEEGWAGLIYAGSIVLIALAVVLLHKFGVTRALLGALRRR